MNIDQKIQEILKEDGFRRGEEGLLVSVFASALADHDPDYFDDQGLMFSLFCAWLEIPKNETKRRVMKSLQGTEHEKKTIKIR